MEYNKFSINQNQGIKDREEGKSEIRGIIKDVFLQNKFRYSDIPRKQSIFELGNPRFKAQIYSILRYVHE